DEEGEEPGVPASGGGLRDGLRRQPHDPEMIGEVGRVVVIRGLEKSQTADDQECEGEQPQEEAVRKSAREQEAGTVPVPFVRAEGRVHTANARPPLLDRGPRRVDATPGRRDDPLHPSLPTPRSHLRGERWAEAGDRTASIAPPGG